MSKQERKENRIMNTYLAAMLLVAVLGMVLTACGAAESSSMSLNKIVDALYKDVDVPAHEIITLDKTSFESYAFTAYDEAYHAVAADALVNITAHSVVVIHTDKSDGAELAASIVKNADPNKWLCVGAEVVDVAYTDNYVVLIMSYKDIADEIVANFKKLAPDLDGMEMNLLSSDNPRFEEDAESRLSNGISYVYVPGDNASMAVFDGKSAAEFSSGDTDKAASAYVSNASVSIAASGVAASDMVTK